MKKCVYCKKRGKYLLEEEGGKQYWVCEECMQKNYYKKENVS